MNKYFLLIVAIALLSGCGTLRNSALDTFASGFLFVDMPVTVEINGQDDFIQHQFKLENDMVILCYDNDMGYYMQSVSPKIESKFKLKVPKGSILMGKRISRVNGWPNGTYYHYIASLEDRRIFKGDFVVQVKMNNLYYPLDAKLFKRVK